MLTPLRLIGASVLSFMEKAGEFTLFLVQGVAACFRPPIYGRLMLKEFVDMGYYSVPVVGLTTLFTGMALALQTYTGFVRFSAEDAIPNVVVISITRELGPVLSGLMFSGRVGASIAAALGSMRVTEQIDALYTLSTRPIHYLVVPKLVAGALMVPLLVVVGDVIGVLGGYIVSTYAFHFNGQAYLRNTWDFVTAEDVLSGLVKASVFGFIVALMGCFYGFTSEGGAQGVGKATTRAVVASSILILISNYFITRLFFAQ